MNDNVFMSFYIGENGGGKSTLLNALSRSNPNGTLTIGFNAHETISKTAFSVLESLTPQQSETLKSILSDMFIWFEDFILTDRKVMVKTTHETIGLDKCATGFYCIQYYLAIILSPMTPQTISIDNVDSGINPKLCRVLIKTLAALAKKSNKKLFLTGNLIILNLIYFNTLFY